MKRFLAIATLLSAFLVTAFAHAGPFDFLNTIDKRALERPMLPSEAPIMTICSSALISYKAAVPKVAACDEAAKWGVMMGLAQQSEEVALEEDKHRWSAEFHSYAEKYNPKLQICNELPGVLESKWNEGASNFEGLAIVLPKLTKVAMGILKDMEFKVCQTCGNWPDGSSGHPCPSSTEATSAPTTE